MTGRLRALRALAAPVRGAFAARARAHPLAPWARGASAREFRGGGGAQRHGYDATAVDVGTAVRVEFVTRGGGSREVLAPLGATLLEVAHANDIDLEGACEGSLACSTCHVYLDEASFAKLDEPCDDENDMLDLAFALTEHSRLGCQVCAAPELNGMRVTLPPATRNMAVDGYVPQPH